MCSYFRSLAISEAWRFQWIINTSWLTYRWIQLLMNSLNIDWRVFSCKMTEWHLLVQNCDRTAGLRTHRWPWKLWSLWDHSRHWYLCSDVFVPGTQSNGVIVFCLTKLNSMVWVRERTIPTERPPLVGEVISNFCGQRVPRGQRTDPYGRILGFLDRSRYFSIK
jgi:hypothetical protein